MGEPGGFKNQVTALLAGWFIKLAFKDLPLLVIQAIVRSSAASAVVTLALVSTVVTTAFSAISFVFFVLLPLLRLRKGGKINDFAYSPVWEEPATSPHDAHAVPLESPGAKD